MIYITMLMTMFASGLSAPRAEAPALEAVDRYIAAKMRSAHIPGLTLAIVRHDSILYLKGYGKADEWGRAVTPQTPFLLGSITKSITALAILQLADAGAIDLDAPVVRYIPWFHTMDSTVSARITVRHLLTMRSGLPQVYETQVWTRQDDDALEACVRTLAAHVTIGEPGRATTYSNANYETLGLIVQTVSGMPYEEYVVRRVFAPLDMRHSFASLDRAARDGMAAGHRWWFGIPVPYSMPLVRAELPAGYLIASGEDMAHFLIAEMNDGRYASAAVLSTSGMRLRHTEPATPGYGYGLEFVRHNGRTWINHDGGTANFQASMFFDPEARVGVFIGINVDNALDAFASPPGLSPLDGGTTRAMAQVVLSTMTGQPLPDQGPGHERLTLMLNLVIAALSALLLFALARIPRRRRRLEARGIPDWAALLGHSARIAILNFAVPIALLYATLAVPAWRVIAQFQPDLADWIVAVAIILFVKGAVELSFAFATFGRTQRVHLLSPSAHVSAIRPR